MTLFLIRLLLVSFFIISLCAARTYANPAANLVSSGSLSIDAALSPESGAVSGQKMQLTLIVATDRWFTGGSRISIPEVPGLVILQNEKFANNASETRNGQTWVIQRWTVDVFPQRPGDFTIPPLEVTVKVNGGDSGNIEGSLFSTAVTFTASTPAGLEDVGIWVAAPAYEVRQSFDRELDTLVVGDAFEQEVVLEASDVMAMMLPTYSVTPQKGLAAYPAPVELENKMNRGQAIASRRVRISYVVETPGSYSLPAHEYYWWNTETAKLQKLSLPQTQIKVAGQIPTSQTDELTSKLSLRLLLSLVVLALGVAVLVKVLFKLWPMLPIHTITQAWGDLAAFIRTLRKPALPVRLNPGSSAED